MRVPLSWLREYVDPGMAPEELATRLSRSGTLVEAVHHLGVPAANGNLAAFRVGRVLEASQHPNADRLRVCRVDLGDGAPRQIVCGAPNVASGQTVAVALPGALLPGAERPLAAARLRGEESDGMILSQTELRLGDDADGIMVLDDGLRPGTPLAEVLPLSETVLELEVTSNRPDCLAVYGVAREVHAVTAAPLRPLDESDPPAEGPGRVEDHASIEVQAPDLCPRYMARVFADVRVGPSPGWLRARIEAAGMRPISNVVDVTNYVMLLTGAAAARLRPRPPGGATVIARRARDGERIVTLDGQERELDSSMLAIADAERPAVIAGIFGAEFAEVRRGDHPRPAGGGELRRADDPRHVARRSACAASRAAASRRACRASCPRAGWRSPRGCWWSWSAQLVPGTIDAREPARRAPAGDDAPRARAAGARHRGRPRGVRGDPGAARLRPLTSDGAGADRARPLRARQRPDARDRPDRGGRAHPRPRRHPGRAAAGGGARAPQPRPGRSSTGSRGCAPIWACGRRSRTTTSPRPTSTLCASRADDPRRDLVRMDHPMSGEMAVMRRSMLPGLLRAAARNQAHQRPDGGLFEIGRTYAPREDGLADERRFLAAVRWGRVGAEGWRGSPRPADVHAPPGWRRR